jgi:hypothetical protein
LPPFLFWRKILVDLKSTDEFSFFVPVETISKSQDIGDKDDRRLIQGIASTDHIDLQGESVVQSGMDTSYFLKYGYINDDHKPGPEHKVGEPIECRSTKAGLWIKAFLYKGQERAEYWWQLMQSLEQSNANRKVGFSIQGKILRRSGNSIMKCWLQDIAITASPVNTHTWAEIVKSLGNERWCLHPWKPLEKSCKGCPGNAKCETSIPAMIRAKDKEDEKKALTTGAGRSLIPQSLEGSAKVQTYKSLTHFKYEDAVQYLQLEKGYSVATAKAIADAIFVAKGLH